MRWFGESADIGYLRDTEACASRSQCRFKKCYCGFYEWVEDVPEIRELDLMLFWICLVKDAPSSMRELVWRPRSSDELLRKRSKWQNALCLQRMKKLSNKPRDEDERVIIGSRVVFEQVL